MSRKMKDSGVEWIGEIPGEWKVERLQWHRKYCWRALPDLSSVRRYGVSLHSHCSAVPGSPGSVHRFHHCGSAAPAMPLWMFRHPDSRSRNGPLRCG